jgi:iron complex outermembrane recepter protein
VFARYDISLPGGSTPTPTWVATFSSGYFGQPTNAAIEKQGSYVKTDLKLNRRMSDRFGVQACVDNMSDKQTINRCVWGGGGSLQVSAASPHAYGLKLSYMHF